MTTRRTFLGLLGASVLPLAPFRRTPIASAVLRVRINAADYGMSEWATGPQNTRALQRALNAAAGGIVHVPAGRYYVGECFTA